MCCFNLWVTHNKFLGRFDYFWDDRLLSFHGFHSSQNQAPVGVVEAQLSGAPIIQSSVPESIASKSCCLSKVTVPGKEAARPPIHSNPRHGLHSSWSQVSFGLWKPNFKALQSFKAQFKKPFIQKVVISQIWLPLGRRQPDPHPLFCYISTLPL